jgi:hypothetical protein
MRVAYNLNLPSRWLDCGFHHNDGGCLVMPAHAGIQWLRFSASVQL